MTERARGMSLTQLERLRQVDPDDRDLRERHRTGPFRCTSRVHGTHEPEEISNGFEGERVVADGEHAEERRRAA